MSHVVHLSDEQYQIVEALAAAQKQTPEELIDALLARAWEELCATYDSAFEDDPSWLETAREAETNTAATGEQFPSTEALFERLGANEEELARAHRLDQAATPDMPGRDRANV